MRRDLDKGGHPGCESPIDAVVTTQFVVHDGDFSSHISLPIIDGIWVYRE